MTAATSQFLAAMLLAAILPGAAGISGTADSNGVGAPTGVVIKDAKPMILRGGKPTESMDHEMPLDNGARVTPDGKLMTKDGQQMQLRDGTVIMKSGRIMHGSHAMPMAAPPKPAPASD